jgi:hypothetical protein
MDEPSLPRIQESEVSINTFAQGISLREETIFSDLALLKRRTDCR